MNSKSLKSKAVKGMLWNTVEKFSVQLGQIVISIVLARILMPSDFGLVGMLAIFISLSQTLINSGMGSALIQKLDRTDKDFATVFFFNLAISSIIYLILYATAPLIAGFYKMPELIKMTRILSLVIIINSLGLVQSSRLTIDLDFRTQAKINVISVILSGGIAIILAYSGFGVWALVLQNILRSLIGVILLWIYNKWQPRLIFSRKSFKELFGFGSRIMGAGIIATFVNNIYKISIGKYYSAQTLGYYTQSFQLADSSAGTITSVLQKVTYPVLAALKEDETKMLTVYRKILGMIAFCIFPAMALFALLAHPFVKIFLTVKWLPIVPLLQWLCLSKIVYPIGALNMNILNARGRSDLYLKADILKFPLIVIVLIITLPMGINAIVIGNFVTSIFIFYINAYMPGKLFDYGPLKQLKDMAPKFIATVIMALIVYLSIMFIDNSYLKVIIGVIIGGLSYLGASIVLKASEINEIKLLLLRHN